MLGLIRIQKQGIVAKSGFKYIRLDPKMTWFSERNAIAYHDELYPFVGDKLYIHYNENNIFRETMTAVFLNDCQPLNLTQTSGECRLNTGFKCLVFDQQLVKLAPITTRRISGPQEYRTDTFCYNKNNFLKILRRWDRNGEGVQIESSEPNKKMLDQECILKTLSHDFPLLYQFLIVDKQNSNLMIAVVNQEYTNRQHLLRFCKKYSTLFMNICKVDPYNFKSLDVIDLENVSTIRISQPAQLNNYNVLDFLTNSVRIAGKGFTKECFNNIPEEKFVYLFVDDCVYHRIHIVDRKTILFIKTQPEDLKDATQRSLLLIKFNKFSLQNLESRTKIKLFSEN